MPISKSKSVDVRLNFISTIHYHHETLELVLIIKLIDLLRSWYYLIKQKIIEKNQDIKLAK